MKHYVILYFLLGAFIVSACNRSYIRTSVQAPAAVESTQENDLNKQQKDEASGRVDWLTSAQTQVRISASLRRGDLDEFDSADSSRRLQGKEIASQVYHLRESAESGAAALKALQDEQSANVVAAEDLRDRLRDAEEEIELLRLQAQRAAILEVQSVLSSRLVEDLQVSFSSGHSHTLYLGCKPIYRSHSR
jgi:hypothetical protein